MEKKKGKSFLVHRLVAKCFLEPIEGKNIINHIDENPSNNYIDNLEWCDVRYNNCYGTKPERLSKVLKGKNKGKHLSEETKQKISKAMKGKNLGENNPMYGKHLSEETKQKMSEAKKGKPRTEETKQKMSNLRKGKPNYKKRKPILQYTLDGEFVKEWDSATTVSKKLNITVNAITACCRGEQKTCKGFIWRYKNNG